jgi:TRAP-type C4-dicarboxylate transport system permease small subunit
MMVDHGGDPPVSNLPAGASRWPRRAGRIVSSRACAVSSCCVTGIALTILLTGNVVARYVMASGGIDAAQELPELLFPWFIVAGIALAAQAGGHLGVDWLYDRLGTRGRVWLLHLVNAIVIASYLILCWQSLLLAENTWGKSVPCSRFPPARGTWPWRWAACSWLFPRHAPPCALP